MCIHVCVTGSPCCTVGKKKCVLGEITTKINKKKDFKKILKKKKRNIHCKGTVI